MTQKVVQHGVKLNGVYTVLGSTWSVRVTRPNGVFIGGHTGLPARPEPTPSKEPGRLEKMREIGQIVDCGVFALASALQIPYPQADALLFPPGSHHDGLVDFLMIKRVLKQLGRRSKYLETPREVGENLHRILLVANDIHFRVWCPVSRRLFDADSEYLEHEMPSYLSWQPAGLFCALALL